MANPTMMQDYAEQDQRVAVCMSQWESKSIINRAYSLITVKSVVDDQRVIEGIASTPTTDRMGDVIDLEGMAFKTPMPLLYQHNARQPIGQVLDLKKTAKGLVMKAKIMAGIGVGFIDEAWALIKAGLVPGLSIGFRSTTEPKYNKETDGFYFAKTEVFEISAVTIPANAEASILTVKSIDAEVLAALGNKDHVTIGFDNNLPAFRGNKIVYPKGRKMKTIPEQISAFENKRAASQARLDEIMEKAAADLRTLDASEREEADILESEVEDVDKHIVRLKAQEQRNIAKAAPVQGVKDPGTAAAVRHGEAITVKSNLPQGIAMARLAICQIRAHGNPYEAAQLAAKFYSDTPEVELMIKAAVEAADTTTSGWASQLVPAAGNANKDFLALLRPMTILGRLNLRQVPFNTAVPVQSGGGTYAWVGEAVSKPVTSATFTSVTVPWYKAAGIIVITEELAKFSSPSAELVIRDEMLAGLAQFLDVSFVNTSAAVASVAPAGILNGVSATAATGSSAATFRTDMANMLDNMTANNINVGNLVLLMSATQAIRLSLMVTDLGVALFPNIGVTGGSILGFPVIVSESVGSRIIALDPSQIFYAEDGAIRIDVSREASVEMSNTPVQGDTSPITGVVLKSLWQNNLIGLRVEAYRAWIKGRTAAVEYINVPNGYLP